MTCSVQPYYTGEDAFEHSLKELRVNMECLYLLLGPTTKRNDKFQVLGSQTMYIYIYSLFDL